MPSAFPGFQQIKPLLPLSNDGPNLPILCSQSCCYFLIAGGWHWVYSNIIGHFIWIGKNIIILEAVNGKYTSSIRCNTAFLLAHPQMQFPTGRKTFFFTL